MASNNEKPAGTSGGSSDVDRVSRQDHPKAMGFARHSKERRIPLPAEEASALAAAHALAAHGLAVFPVREDCRRPFTKHGYKDAAKYPEDVEALWLLHPGANIAVACGAASGAFVLDVDVKGAQDGRNTLADLEADHGALPWTWRTRTPTGGLHFWFRQPALRLKNRVGFLPGLDVRTDGGSVVVPPSRRIDGVYQWEAPPWSCDLAEAPDWLLDRIAPPPLTCSRPVSIPSGSIDRMSRYAAAVINGECREVATCARGFRNERLFRASARVGDLVGTGLIPRAMAEFELTQAAIGCGLVADDGNRAVLETIKSGLNRGTANPRGVRTLM
jgi:hypothetical protein